MKKTFVVVGTAKISHPGELVCPPLSIALTNLGYKEVSLDKANYLISINHNKKLYKKFLNSGRNSSKAALIRVEPPAVYPSQYQKRIEKLYESIFTPGEANFKSNPNLFLGWPYEKYKNPAKPYEEPEDLKLFLDSNEFRDQFDIENWETRINKMHLIASNKVSPTNQSNYNIRRRFAHNIHPDLLDLYGYLWAEPLAEKIFHRLAVLKNALYDRIVVSAQSIYGNLLFKYPSWVGQSEDKFLTSKNYKYALVIENSNNYVSEKFIDALIAGCITFYYGPDLEESGFPDGLAIQCTGDIENLEATLDQFDDDYIRRMLERIRDFLLSDYFFINWQSQKVFDSIARKLDESWTNN